MRKLINRHKDYAEESVVNSQVLRNPFSRSFCLHLFLLMLLMFYAAHAPKFTLPSEPITIDVVDAVQPKVKKITESSRSKTIVQKSEGELADEAKKDAYLSDKTRVVKEERSASHQGEVIPLSRPSTKAQEATHPKTNSKHVQLSDLGMKLSPKEAPDYEKDRNWAPSETGETIRGGQYIQGMKEGEVSALNTKEFVFYSYFERVRRQLDQAWQPLLREQVQRLYKNGRHLASNADYVTRTLVTLNQKGEVTRVQLLEESGTLDLDQVAVDALNKAGPYPNPPKGLIGDSGNVQIRWDFILRT